MKHLALLLFSVGLFTGFYAIFIHLRKYQKVRNAFTFMVLAISSVITLKIILDNVMFYIWLNMLSGNNSPYVIFWYYIFSFIISFIFVFSIPPILNRLFEKPKFRLPDAFFIISAVITLLCVSAPYFLLILFPFRHNRVSPETIFFVALTVAAAYILLFYLANLKKILSGNLALKLIIIFAAYIIYGGFDLGEIKKMIYFDVYPESLKYHLIFYNFWNIFLIFTGLQENHSSNMVFPHIEEIPAGFSNEHRLTVRETEIIKLLIPGKSNLEIAENLFISARTVKNHLYNIYQKLGVKNRVELLHKVAKSINR